MEQRLGEWGKWGGEGLKGNWSAKRSGHWSQVGEVPRWVFQALNEVCVFCSHVPPPRLPYSMVHKAWLAFVGLGSPLKLQKHPIKLQFTEKINRHGSQVLVTTGCIRPSPEQPSESHVASDNPSYCLWPLLTLNNTPGLLYFRSHVCFGSGG